MYPELLLVHEWMYWDLFPSFTLMKKVNMEKERTIRTRHEFDARIRLDLKHARHALKMVAAKREHRNWSNPKAHLHTLLHEIMNASNE
jgi:hypothetical protein